MTTVLTTDNYQKVIDAARKQAPPAERLLFDTAQQKQIENYGQCTGAAPDDNPTFAALVRSEREMESREFEMRKIINVELLHAEPNEAEIYGSSSEHIALLYENLSNKDIRAFKGMVHYRDVLGNDLATIPLDVLKPLGSGKRDYRTENYYADISGYAALYGKAFDDIRIEWRPETILFADGTSLSCR